MKKVPIISTIQTTVNSLKAAAKKQNIENVDIAVFDRYENIVSFFKYEIFFAREEKKDDVLLYVCFVNVLQILRFEI